jgi:hypothetical protein
MMSQLISLRRNTLSRALLPLFTKIFPKIGKTERIAIEAGTVWWDADLFGKFEGIVEPVSRIAAAIQVDAFDSALFKTLRA